MGRVVSVAGGLGRGAGRHARQLLPFFRVAGVKIKRCPLMVHPSIPMGACALKKRSTLHSIQARQLLPLTSVVMVGRLH